MADRRPSRVMEAPESGGWTAEHAAQLRSSGAQPVAPTEVGNRVTLQDRIREVVTSGSLTARIMRGSVLSLGNVGLSQALRLLSNLVLTRLLFPEAFGLMALVTVFLVGLAMFSDTGVGTAVARSPRGDDPEFLNTAWTLQILRGVFLFFVGCALAGPFASFYGEPILRSMLIVASVQLFLAGFMPTKRDTENRHLRFGRLIVIDLSAQVVGLLAMAALAFWLRSVWALVLGSLMGTVFQLLFTFVFLPGRPNRLRLEGEAVRELFNFGKWIFLSTIFGFLFVQGDKLILGKFLQMDAFGLYNIGFSLGSLPVMLGTIAISRLLIPIYRERPPGESRDNFLKLRRMRVLVTGGLVSVTTVAALAGPWLVELLYDARYHDAGAIVVLVALVQIPTLIVLTYESAALAAGETRGFFVAQVIKSVLSLTGIYLGAQAGGLAGALIGQGLAMIASYPVPVWLVKRFGAWDPMHDLGFAALAVPCGGLALWWNWEAMMALAT